MKHALTTSALITVISLTSSQSIAALASNATLLIEDGSYFDLTGPVFGLGQTPITGINGIILGTTQPYDFSSSANVIDQFSFLAATGMHFTTAPTSVLSTSGNNATIDFSGWEWTFNNGLTIFDLGSGAWGSNPEGIANIVCGIDCGNGDSFTLAYTATVPDNEPNGYAGYLYELHLTGTVSSVPVPAAIWLLGSGLLGLSAVARLRKPQ